MAIKDIKNQIISAAVKEFVACGYSGARMQAIADKAGINKALLHYHFSSKEKLYHVVLKSQFSALAESLIDIFSSDEDFEPWLRRIIRELLHNFSARPHFSRFVIWELNTKGKHLSRIFEEVLRNRMQGMFLERIAFKLEESGIRDYPPQQFLLNLLSLCIYPSIARPLLEQVMGKEVFSDPDFISKREEEIFQLIKHGIIHKMRGEK